MSWTETIPPDEESRFARYAEQLGDMQKRRDGDGTKSRALHARQLGGVRAEFEVLPNVPPEAAVGIFGTPRVYPAFVRYSSGAARQQPDSIADIRGMAVKVLEVPGNKILSGKDDAHTQDFLMIQSPVLPFRNTDEFMFVVNALMKNPRTVPFKILGRFGLFRTIAIAQIQRKRFGRRIPTLAGERFWSPVPIQWGERAAKFGVVPVAGVSAPRASGSPATYLADEFAERLAHEPVAYDFRVQFFVDAKQTPIEDASVEWTEDVSPFITVARLVIPVQDVASDEGRERAASVEKMSFDPWHAPEEFRPLGDIMRARKHAYFVSGKGRGAAGEPGSA
jgi:hypothetical protein